MQLKRSGPAPSQAADGRVFVCPPPSTRGESRMSSVEVSVTIQTQSILSRRSPTWRGPAWRGWLASVLLVGLLPTASFGADKPKTINIDWATYNPVSMLLKDKGLLEKEFAKDGITVRWVKTVSSSNALQFLSAASIDFGSTAGSAALVARINGNPIKAIYTYSRPEGTR